MLKRARYAAYALAALCLLIGTSETQGRIARPAYFYKVFAAEVQGLVFFSDAQTPAADVPVRVWDTQQRDFIYETTTDEYGAYRLPKLAPGKYYITFDSIRLELEVLPPGDPVVALAQQPHDIIIIIPRGTASMPMTQLNTLLIASTITEGALIYQNEDRQSVVSP